MRSEAFPSFTKTSHKKPYESIDPRQAKLSAAGKTVLITAGHTGIGYAIAQSFALASASNIILLARRQEVLDHAAKTLASEHPKTKFHYFAASIIDFPKIKDVFEQIRSSISPNVDILVTSAVFVSQPRETLAFPASDLEAVFKTNFLSNVRELLANPAALPKTSEKVQEKIIIDISSVAAHLILTQIKSTAYSVSKLAFTQYLAHLQAELGAEGKAVRVHSLHPGAILTDAARGNGYDENTIPWDDVKLPGNFAVWLASKEAELLKRRFVWASWDAEELKQREGELEANKDLLRIGLVH
jgi:NAD(P)-dependent dehydrogenase (short-subunit alcohol dehydrogenase family)